MVNELNELEGYFVMNPAGHSEELCGSEFSNDKYSEYS